MNDSTNFLKFCLVMTTASKVLAGPVQQERHVQTCNGLINPGFETGSLEGWQVVDGNAFGNISVTDSVSYWDGPFHQDQKYFILGTAQAGETAIGNLKSSSFRAASNLSFLIGGGYDPDHLYVGLVRDQDNQLLLKQTGINDEALIRIIWDTSEWAGEQVHIIVHDSSTEESWGHINFDDLRIGRHALGNGQGRTFNVIGQSNQPPGDSSPACSLYAEDPIRPQYHYTPYQGWINDPAGLSQWNGHHHLFSQFFPDSPFWGPMHWAHAESTDAVHWRTLPDALSPKKTEIPGDDSGRFTGSAMIHENELHLVFTDIILDDFKASLDKLSQHRLAQILPFNIMGSTSSEHEFRHKAGAHKAMWLSGVSAGDEVQFTAIIDTILATADLTTITRKKIRAGLERALGGKDLSDQKDAIKALIEQRFDHFTASEQAEEADTQVKTEASPHNSEPQYGYNDEAAGSDGEGEPAPARKKQKREASSEDADAKLAAQLQAQENSMARGRATRGASVPKKRKAPKKKSSNKVKTGDDSDVDGSDGAAPKRKPGGGFQKPFNLSYPLAELLKEPQLSRPQVVKKLWEHIKGNNLQDPTNKRQIICDAPMEAVFKLPKVDMFQMNKLIGSHLYPVEEEQ
ncbi:hypothetical protein BN1723_012701 [Verticillium longisporum]|uniref:Uncharacterized protein n=1 Tax=Verticillium longisporum TaxID=100787 RepID=A0A0G4LKS9_VERLO|nr:hypothetical protein BN1723_012701 [Verticillium longisporum]